MFDVIEDAIVKVLQENLTDVPKRNIVKERVDPTKKTTLPLISVYNADFTLEQVGLGSESGETREEVSETFSGDGKVKSFTNSVKPLRPIISVESPAGVLKKEGEDFTVDYQKGVMTFHSPPEKGKDNILVRFRSMKGVSVLRSLKLTARYYVDVWASDTRACEALAVEAINTLLIGRDELAEMGLNVRPVGGKTLEDGQTNSGAAGKRLEYSIETELRAKIPVPPIERIELQKKPMLR